MKTIYLKRQENAPFDITHHNLNDDVLFPVIGDEAYMFTATNPITTYSLTYLIDNFLWPSDPVSRVESFLKGYNPELAAKIQHYK